MQAEISATPEKIYLYAGFGTNDRSVSQVQKSFSRCGISSAQVIRLDGSYIAQRKWEEGASLFIVPGGRPSYINQGINEEGIQKVQQFVFQGGSFLGLCAGGYFACEKMEYHFQANPTRLWTFNLRLFSGTAIGPSYYSQDYDDLSEKTARLSRIRFMQKEDFPSDSAFSLWNGGSFFHFKQEPGLETIATYDDISTCPPAIVFSEEKPGKVILSGVHIEDDLDPLPNEEILSQLEGDLTDFQAQQQKIWRAVCRQLGLTYAK